MCVANYLLPTILQHINVLFLSLLCMTVLWLPENLCMYKHSIIGLIAERLSVRRIIVGCILAINDRPTDLYVLILYVGL